MHAGEVIARAREAERGGDWDAALAHYEEAFGRLLELRAAPEEFADLLRWIGTVHRQRGDLEPADEAYVTSLAISEAADLPSSTASVLNCIAIIAQYRGDVTTAETSYARARELAARSGNDRIAAMIEVNHATLESIRGNLTVAIGCYLEALDRFRALGDEAAVVSVLNNLGMAYRDNGSWSEAESSFDEACDRVGGLGDATLLGNIELNRAELYLKSADLLRAREHCDRAFEVFTKVESRAGLGEACKLYGALFTRMGRPSLADAHLDRALELALASEDRLLQAEVYAQRANAHLDSDRSAEALHCLNTAYRLFQELGARTAQLDLDRRLDLLETTYLEIVASWAASIDAKDSYTAGHCARVAELGSRLAETCGITGRELTWFRMGGFLHDVGKTEVPLEVLNKPGKLLPDEWELMKSHTVAGARIVEELNFPRDIVSIVRSHHERWNGTGYPDGIAGEAIPLNARILGIADIYDALTTARAYRPAMSHDEAFGIMERDAGVGIDPVLFARFRQLIAPAAQLCDVA